ncbi:MAG: hypothetical protein K6G68_05675 [Oscillospiraceae bacterium]|nr:hypothetical protein [Oscillospiraceae bacterium]
MNNTVIKGVVVAAPAPETSESYTRFEMLVRETGKKEPVIVEMYGMRDIIARYPKGAEISIVAKKKTRPVMNRVLYGFRKTYDNFFTALAVT